MAHTALPCLALRGFSLCVGLLKVAKAGAVCCIGFLRVVERGVVFEACWCELPRSIPPSLSLLLLSFVAHCTLQVIRVFTYMLTPLLLQHNNGPLGGGAGSSTTAAAAGTNSSAAAAAAGGSNSGSTTTNSPPGVFGYNLQLVMELMERVSEGGSVD